MRVLIVSPEIRVYGGAELLIVKLANYMTKKGIENALLTTSIIPEVANDLHRTKIIIRRRSRLPPREIMTLYEGVRENLRDFDVINVHNYPAEFSVFLCRKPAVWMCNEPYLHLPYDSKPSLSLRMERSVLSTIEKLIVKRFIKYAVVADEANAKRFKEIYGFKPIIIHYGVDYEFFSKGDSRRALEMFNLDESDFIVLQVGMLTPFKNQMASIKAVERIKTKIPNIKLVLAGLGGTEYELMLRNYVKRRGLERIVIFTGHLDRQVIRDLYHACNVLLHPIRPQGGWLAPFEALCAGKPIVVSEEMTASSIIKREGIGIVTCNYVEALWDIYKNPDKYIIIGEKGRKWVNDNLSWDKFCKKMVSLFYKAMEGGER